MSPTIPPTLPMLTGRSIPYKSSKMMARAAVMQRQVRGKQNEELPGSMPHVLATPNRDLARPYCQSIEPTIRLISVVSKALVVIIEIHGSLDRKNEWSGANGSGT